MVEMVEKVARAIAVSLDEDNPRFVRQSWEQMTELAREAMMKRARAAIEAMREPTARMLSCGPYIDEVNPAVPNITESQAHAAWEAMITAALAEQKTPA